MYDFFAGAAVVLMLLDGFLTQYSFKLYRERASRFVVVESLELNPVWARSVASGRIAANPFRLALVAFVAAALFVYRQEWFLGLVFFPNLFVFIRHLNNLFSFLNYAGNVRGKTWFSSVFGVRTTVFAVLAESLIPLAAYFFVPREFFLGGAAGCWILAAYLYASNLRTLRKPKPATAKPSPSWLRRLPKRGGARG